MLRRGTLWPTLTRASERALRAGALVPIPTRFGVVEDAGIRFLVRVVSNLARKPRAVGSPDGPPGPERTANPFLPYDEEMFVAEVSDTHVCLLNKYNVIDRHALIVTRAFEEQDRLLTVADLAAMLACLAEIDGLAFYNGGEAAGSSQPHRHLQIVPLPLADGFPALPLEPLIEAADLRGGPAIAPGLPFGHALARVDPGWIDRPEQGAGPAVELYRSLFRRAGMPCDTAGPGGFQPGPYNLLATRRWMLLVPRSRHCFGPIAVNALGFAGALLVWDEGGLELLKTAGPMSVLTSLARPRT